MAGTSAPAIDSDAPAHLGTRGARGRGLLRWGWLAAGVAAAGVVVWMVVLAARGMVLRFSPVPWFDTWSALVAADQQVSQGAIVDGVWAPYNGHRYVLTRLLFMADRALADGNLAWLIVANGLLALALAAALTWLSWRMLPSRAARLAFGALSVVVCTSWVNYENLTWELQSQLILAPLLAVLAFTAAGVGADAQSRSRGTAWFGVAVACALLAVLSMSSGVAVPVVLVLLLAVMRVPWRLTAGVAVIAVLAAVGYFVGLPIGADAAVGGSGQPTPPLEVFAGALAFLGGPVAIVFKSVAAAVVVGAVVAVSGTYYGFRAVRGALTPAQSAGVAVVVFAGITAVIGAALRTPLGIGAMTASRYQYIVFAAWVAILAVAMSRVRTPRAVAVGFAGIGALVLVLAVFQVAALERPSAIRPQGEPPLWPPTAYRTDLQSSTAVPPRLAAGLGVALGVPDLDAQVPLLYPDPTTWPGLAAYAREQGIGAFGGLLAELEPRLGTTDPGRAEVPCAGGIISSTPVPADAAWSRVRGWAYDVDGQRRTRLVALRAADGTIAGYAVTGFRTPDGLALEGGDSDLAGFSGYVRTATAGQVRVVCLAD